EALEEIIDIFVVGPLAFSLEATGEEEGVDPVHLMGDDQPLDQLWGDFEAELPVLSGAGADFAVLEIQDDVVLAQLQQDAAIDAHASEVPNRHQGFKPGFEFRQDVDLPMW